jgi:predicted RNA-binding Zn ribbon-like protein
VGRWDGWTGSRIMNEGSSFPAQPPPAMVAGNPALDFANTATGLEADGWRDYLTDMPALLAWCRQAQGIPDPEFRELRCLAPMDEEGAGRLLAGARGLRDALNRLFSAVASGAPPPVADLALLNAELAALRSRERIVWSPKGFDVEIPAPGAFPGMPAVLLAPVLRAAFDLLTGPSLDRVRQCASQSCEWLFLDTSKNGRRRWCRMSVCGNREKGRRHNARTGSAQGPAGLGDGR